ncbi:MAG: MetQ/NlpA family ABC transporter substrate-binding protein [Bacillota bacterium]|uniref:Lipoprotein n=1 Tax=Virgibacillus salarius TaxID=447199 RepID=A0A941ICB6_9BACI|nr:MULTISPECIES: MetQ/NlpA family ABC transporter substrate-binding protein [Bacillaceae]NAZ09946.1 MetQ/NlpA family ABC transporter substrate-binding protein [Agaribacter marinus]MBR7797237.1 MetQ/NlpA family ABC transporter substrate-binding protein [Virgibacillus salarius]MCC2250149.1 MetQ/NlpA family ABC transporter substrate-binding protein [Virgibacillus sp. AGTR]MDY7045709.1 MetQ/NlpA family ABC transporter substrate-binding protein [Virgibacillus sp. M23]QRZ19032.1 MetQ/NlpA family ABC
MKRITIRFLLIILTSIITACSSSDAATTVKVGISGSDTAIWDYVAEKAKKEGIDVEIVRFSDYVQPNLALAEGEIDANAFQTVSYFDAFIEEHHLDLTPIATTVIAPMGLYSEKHDRPEDIPEGGTIALAKEATNMGRGLLLLQDAGLITLEEGFDGNGSLDKIVENPKNLQFELLVAGQTPRVLPDVDASIINNGIAVDAGFSPLDDSIYHEDETATPYINIIAVQKEDQDDEVLKKLADIYQTEDVANFIEKERDGNSIPTFVPLNEIGH